jgi:hypothetical protein
VCSFTGTNFDTAVEGFERSIGQVRPVAVTGSGVGVPSLPSAVLRLRSYVIVRAGLSEDAQQHPAVGEFGSPGSESRRPWLHSLPRYSPQLYESRSDTGITRI